MNNLRKNYKNNIIGSLLGAFVLSSGGYLAAYLRDVGGTDFHFAMLNALPSMFAVLTLIPGAIIIDSTKHKLKITLLICFLSRSFFLLYALVPFLPKEFQAISLVILLGLRNAPEAVWNIGYQSLMADVFPIDKLNEIIGKRNKYNNILTIGSTFLLGTFLSLDETFPIDNLLLFQILFVFTFFIGIIEILQYKKFDFESKPVEKNGSYVKRLFHVIKTLPQHPKYIKYCATVMIFYLGWQMAWPLYNLYQLNVLNANAAWVGYFGITSTLSQIITIGLWIKLSQKIGSKPVLGIGMFLMALSPCVYAISKTLPMLLAMQLIVGCGMSAVLTLLFNELIYVCPDENRTLYISLFTCLTQITSSFMPFVGIYVKEAISIQAALYISGGIRFLGSIIFLLACRNNKKAENL
ncbi:MFS transporter [Sedimentibacter sp. zth1]|uniref:MFS transporter n=1 Tax=Sedimentibacter sp. zth1 TaxID=2816908 RepID=UPI001A91AC54|nr:MFS transporter [Sedimentibacter sp. zth1]QSX05355.1 MFS transporter [Sedimentibacter sp. zth1]